ncbi:hypothetical protein [Actinokineospora iranica]|uniref:Uncharacterized protein n=1 Tax=Actinokineospora iranica TaxID=1271860 RepID=A0A1G6YG14_9PSEU|nr:hypothetical protein [Actinokineospora iranica]SDD88667.1 hypothetical protein SAMN05216174_12138 [Actinokineospora iranica]
MTPACSTTCSLCGRARADDPPADALAWAREPGPRWLCPACARRHVRDIEGKLPPEYWLGQDRS